MTEPSPSAIRRQVNLPFSKAFSIALKGITIRFWRSLITASGVVLAIAFFTFAMSRDVLLGNYQRQVSSKPAPTSLSEDWLRTARVFLQKQGLSVEPGAEGEPSSVEVRRAGARRTWIIVMSLAVCFLGIVNAQLMSVSERFREIGTMKCLGALDRFVITIFVIESFLQGVVGSLCGIVLGLLLALLQLRLGFGPGALAAFPATAILAWAAVILAVGTSLSMLAAIAPAVRAARLQPADAMRVQE